MKAKLIQDKLIKLDDDDFHLLGDWSWSLNKGNSNYGFYVIRGYRVGGKVKRLFLHRLVAKAEPGDRVSFVTSDTLDLRKSNLKKNGKRLK